MEMVRDLGLDEKVYILAGVTPPRSLGMARYMKKFVPGMDVPERVIERLKGAADQADEGINICVDIINQVKEIKGVSGVHIMAIEWESAVPEIVRRAGLAARPVFADEQITKEPVIEIRDVETAQPPGAGDAVLAMAKAAAEKMIAEARDEVARMRAAVAGGGSVPTTTVHESIELDEAGEHEMNERERQMALETVRFGLDALKKSLGLSDDQFEALVKFATTEAILRKEPPTGVGAGAAPAVAPVPAAAVVAAAPAVPAADTAKAAAAQAAEAKAAEAKAAEAQAAVAQAELAKKAAAEAAAREEAARKAATAAAQTAAPQKETPPQAEKPAPQKTAAAGVAGATTLALEKTPLAQRASKVPEDHYKVKYTGKIRETSLGAGANLIKVGGATTMPFQLYEGLMPNKPLIAMDILDYAPDEWPETLARHFAGVMDNPLKWAQKCVNDYQAEAICLSLVSTDPNGLNRPAAEAAKIAAEVIDNIDVPIILWGCGNADKDTETLREITSLVGDKKVCLAPLSDANYRSIGATAMAFQHQMVAASPIDVNLAKQLNILLENLGVSLESVLIDPSIGALGYGIEYTYSVMERIRMAAMTQQDEKLQVPIICNLGREVWKAKETKLPTDALLGDQERRGVLMEAMTASCMLVAGGEVLIMRHPQAIALTKSLINGLVD
jgi:CO dehydrogenase/acetyl-CoA synthase delta subunit